MWSGYEDSVVGVMIVEALLPLRKWIDLSGKSIGFVRIHNVEKCTMETRLRYALAVVKVISLPYHYEESSTLETVEYLFDCCDLWDHICRFP